MSDKNWKNDRAEGEMRRAGKEIMKKAALKAKEEEDQKWEDFKSSLYNDVVNLGLPGKTLTELTQENVNDIIDVLRQQGYNLPTKD